MPPYKAFFWSAVFGKEALFISDFGPSFSYKDDAPNNKELIDMKYPSLGSILSKRLIDSVSRFFPLSLTFAKFRILLRFR